MRPGIIFAAAAAVALLAAAPAYAEHVPADQIRSVDERSAFAQTRSPAGYALREPADRIVRTYDGRIGRFLQTDPVGYKDDLNLYQYVHNDPLNQTDPTGRFGGSNSQDERALAAGRETAARCGAPCGHAGAALGVTLAAPIVVAGALEVGTVALANPITATEAVAVAGELAAPGATLGAGAVALAGPIKQALMSSGSREALVVGADLARPAAVNLERAAAQQGGVAVRGLQENPLAGATAQVGARESGAQQAAALESATGPGARATFWEELGDRLNEWLN